MNISVVIPLLNEQDSLIELHEWIAKVMYTKKYSYEVIFIDDGSTDNSWKTITQLSEKDKNVKGIRFLRNVGKSQALAAGFDASLRTLGLTVLALLAGLTLPLLSTVVSCGLLCIPKTPARPTFFFLLIIFYTSSRSLS